MYEKQSVVFLMLEFRSSEARPGKVNFGEARRVREERLSPKTATEAGINL